MSAFAPALSHSDLDEVFPNLFFVTGTMKANFTGTDFQFSRNMVVVREGTTLTIINAVRLSDAGLESLDALGTVKNVVKLGAFHGIDDAFYVDRYQATLWALDGMTHDSGLETKQTLSAENLPFSGASLFVFESSKQPEGLLLVERDGGVLIACDSLQNWVEADPYFDAASAETMAKIGFLKPANIGPGWLHACAPKVADFDAVGALDFKHLLPAHGRPIKETARAQFMETFAAFASQAG